MAHASVLWSHRSSRHSIRWLALKAHSIYCLISPVATWFVVLCASILCMLLLGREKLQINLIIIIFDNEREHMHTDVWGVGIPTQFYEFRICCAMQGQPSKLSSCMHNSMRWERGWRLSQSSAAAHTMRCVPTKRGSWLQRMLQGYWTDNYLQSSSTGCSQYTKMRLTILHSTSRHFIFTLHTGIEKEDDDTTITN